FQSLDLVGQIIASSFALFFLPMFALGMVSPQVIRLAVPDVAHAGRVAGRVYAWSTAGAIAGTFAAGYVLPSRLGTVRTILGITLLVIVTASRVAPILTNNVLLYLCAVALGGVTGGVILEFRRSHDEDTVVVAETNYYTIKVTRSGTDRLTLTLDHLIHS